MTRIFQDTEGEITEILNKSIEQIICLDGVDRNNSFTNIFSIWLKVEQEKCWYRIFLNAGGCFGEIYNSTKYKEVYSEDIDDDEDCPIYQIESLFSLQELTIVSALVYPYNVFSGVELKIVFDNGDYLILQEAKEPDSENNLSVIKV